MHDAYEAGESPDTGWHTAPRAAGPDYLRTDFAEEESDFTMPQASLPPAPSPPPPPPPELRHTAPELRHTAPEPRHPALDDQTQPGGDFDSTRSIVRPDGRHDDERQAAEYEAPTTHQRQVDVERAVPAGQQLRESLERVVGVVRKSIPLRTVLFLLPPLAFPPLAFDLSVSGIVVVWLTLLWLAAAAGVFCTIMVEGNQQRSIERRLERLTQISESEQASDASADDAMQEALLAIGKQLDALDDRISALTSMNRVPAVDDLAQTLSHRPQEQHWPNPSDEEQYDRYGQTAVPDTDWSESRWRR